MSWLDQELGVERPIVAHFSHWPDCGRVRIPHPDLPLHHGTLVALIGFSCLVLEGSGMHSKADIFSNIRLA
jgi:hypothetical protein